MPTDSRDLVVIGTGAAGLVAGHVAGGLGLNVTCIERDRIGGECSWTGCVPSKALLHAARECWRLKTGPGGGIRASIGEIDASGAFEWVREQRDALARRLTPGDLAEVGMEVLMGEPEFDGGRGVTVDGRTLKARAIMIATGSSAAVPPIEGLEETGYLTNREIFELPELPRSLLIVGAGPIGVEMAQAFNRLGAEVTVVEGSDEILPRDDGELAAELRRCLEAEGVKFVLGSAVVKAGRQGNGQREVTLEGGAVIAADELLIATGRKASVDGIESLGVTTNARGVVVDDRMRASHPHVYAAGDVTGDWQFSHMAEYEATRATRNALLSMGESVTYEAAGWTTFTDPELASCGMNERQVRERGLRHGVYRYGFAKDDRARVDQEATGEVKVIAHPTSGRIHGAQILGPRAGELIQEFIVAIARKISIKDLCRTVHVYPALTMTAQRAGQMWWQEYLQRGPHSGMIRQVLGTLGYHPRATT